MQLLNSQIHSVSQTFNPLITVTIHGSQWLNIDTAENRTWEHQVDPRVSQELALQPLDQEVWLVIKYTDVDQVTISQGLASK
jgi:hypothetical protein